VSPLMGLISLAVLAGVVVFIVGAVLRSKTTMLVSMPAVALCLLWLVLASWPINAQREFDRVFGAANREVVSEIRTSKPTTMEGHSVSFRISPADFAARIGSRFSEIPLQSPKHFHQGERLPKGWPESMLEGSLVLHREVDKTDVLVIYYRPHERVYASVRYDGW
jgi:hypothetical protein